MTLPAWPFTGRAPFGGWRMTPQDNRASFQPEIGPPITRRRGTAKAKRWNATYQITSAEFDTFETFFEDDLKDGALPFTMPHPRTCETSTFKFDDGLYSVEEFGTGEVSLTVSIMELP